MDVTQLAHTITHDLAPALPYLVVAGTTVRDGILKGVGTDIWSYTKGLWGKLQHKVEAKPAALEAAQDVANFPDDEEAQIVLRRQIKKLLEEDKVLTNEVADFVQQSRPGGVNVTASGNQSVAVGGNVSGSNIITGNKNKVGQPKPGE